MTARAEWARLALAWQQRARDAGVEAGAVTVSVTGAVNAPSSVRTALVALVEATVALCARTDAEARTVRARVLTQQERMVSDVGLYGTPAARWFWRTVGEALPQHRTSARWAEPLAAGGGVVLEAPGGESVAMIDALAAGAVYVAGRVARAHEAGTDATAALVTYRRGLVTRARDGEPIRAWCARLGIAWRTVGRLSRVAPEFVPTSAAQETLAAMGISVEEWRRPPLAE